MKISLNNMQFYADAFGVGKDPYEYGVDEVVRRIGVQLGAVEDVVKTGHLYEGIVVAKVRTCQQHPDADKLSVCMIDDGGAVQNVERDDKGYVQVVCGAPNVKAGLTVAWIPPGTAVPSSHRTESEPFILSAIKLRGVVSNGMLASPRELEMGDGHQGILEIYAEDVGEEHYKAGTPFGRLYGVDDVVIDLENKMFTHRPDCFGGLGVARELAGIFGDQFTSPAWYTQPLQHRSDNSLVLSVRNEAEDVVSRFTAQVVADVAPAESPVWLQVYLSHIGQKSINHVVDLTNYFMTLTAQPLHAFDYDKVASLCKGDPVLFPRRAKNGETLQLLNGKEIKLHPDDIVIATDTQAVALAGVMGGSETEVDESTRNVIIECATFDMYAIRRTSMRHGLFTDAVTRFTKGQSPLQNDRVLAKMVDDLVVSGGRVASEMLDVTSFDLAADNLNRVEVSTDFINARLGSSLSADDIKQLLENVEFLVTINDKQPATLNSQTSSLTVTVPFWRMDISIAEDIVEEVGRLHGYDSLPVELPRRPSAASRTNAVRSFRGQVRDALIRAGANEVLTYSFVHGDTLRACGTDPDTWAYHLRNALSPDLQFYRTALIPSLLTKINGNIKASAGSSDNQFALFEFGKAHVKNHFETDEPELPQQMRRLACVVAADTKTAKRYSGDSAYYMAKAYVDHITNGQASYQPLESFEYPITSSYAEGRSAQISVNGQVLGVVGEFRRSAHTAFKLPEFCAGFELDTDLLAEHMQKPTYTPLSQFPTTTQDITLEVSSHDMPWSRVYDFVSAELAVAAAEHALDYTVVPLDVYKQTDAVSDDDTDAGDRIRYSFRIALSSRIQTMQTTQINTLLDHIAAQAEKTLHAVRI